MLNCKVFGIMKSFIDQLTYVALALLLAACDKSVELPKGSSPEIMLSADVVSMDRTRATEANVYTGTSTAGMEATVWFSRRCGVYEDNGTPTAPTFLPFRANIKYDSGNPTTVYVNPENKSHALTYPINDPVNNDVYCVGLYPQSGWSSADGTSATHPIDGSVDLMFADQIVGSWEAPFTTQQYKHLLTWVKFEAEASDIKAIDDWGAVTKVTVVSSNGVTITFPTTDGGESTIAYSASTAEIDALGGSTMPLSINLQSLGSLLCAPSSTMKLKIATENIAEKEIEVALKDENGNLITSAEQTAGKLFIINIYFNKFNHIEASCNLVPWNEQNVDLGGE